MSFSLLREAALHQDVLHSVHEQTMPHSFKAQGFWTAVVEEAGKLYPVEMIFCTCFGFSFGMFSNPPLVCFCQQSQFYAASWSFH